MAVQPQEDEPQPPLLLCLQFLLERPYVRVDCGIMLPKGLYRPHGMDNSAMISPAEDSSDFRKGTRGHFLGEVHRNLTRPNNGARAPFGPHFALIDLEMLRRQLLDLINGDAARIGAHEICQRALRSEEHTSELQSLMRISYAVCCLKKKTYS